MNQNNEISVEIKNTRQASRAITVAFRLTTKMIGKSDSRRAEIRTTAKRFIKEAENYMIFERVKYSAGIEPE